MGKGKGTDLNPVGTGPAKAVCDSAPNLLESVRNNLNSGVKLAIGLAPLLMAIATNVLLCGIWNHDAFNIGGDIPPIFNSLSVFGAIRWGDTVQRAGLHASCEMWYNDAV